MAPLKKEKIPFQEYQKQKEQHSKKRFRITLYPLPVLISILIPLLIFTIAIIWYFANVKSFLN